jgi:hypothetical protein
MSCRIRGFAFALCSLHLASCAGATAQQPTATTAAVAPGHPVSVDPALADATADAVIVIRVDGDPLRRSSYYGAMREAARTSSVAAACNGDPLAGVDHATMSIGPAGDRSLLVRGPVTDASQSACATALGAAFQFHEAPVHIGNAMVFAQPSRITQARAVVESGENATNRRLVTLREAVPGDGVVVLADVTRFRSTAAAPDGALPGLDLETTRTLWNGLAGAALVISVPGGDHLALAVETEFDSHDHAEQARTWVSAVLSRGLGQLRTVLQRTASDPSAGQLRAQAGSAFDQLERSLRITTDGAHARLALELDAQSAGVLSALTIPAVIEYLRRGRTAEARDRIAYLTRMTVTYASEHRADAASNTRRGRRGAATASPFPPSAPRTPADVPRGVRVVDPPSVWDHPTWRALSFAMTDPHYFSYEFVNQGSAFTVRAYGDLDGDGTLSTFERSGRSNARGEIDLDPDVRVTDETE